MRRQRMLALVLASAMVVGSVISVNAATAEGWEYRGTDWYYKNTKGEYETDVWRYDQARTHKYYLGDDGKMLVSSLIDDGSGVYYVNSLGEMLQNDWRLLATDQDDEERWFWFTESGKATESGWKNIRGQYYHFTDYRMDYGFLNEDGEMLDDGYYDGGDENWKDATYYVGDNTDGARKNDVWVEVYDFDNDEYENRDSIWLYFGSNGKKLVNKTATINGKRYMFDENGAMVTEWYGVATPSDAGYKYYDNPDGDQERGNWFQAVPSEEQDAEAHDNDDLKWFYAGSNGTTYKDAIKTIKGKKYIFDENGIMRTGFIVVDEDNHIVRLLGEEEDDYPTPYEIKQAHGEGTLMYFKPNGDAATSKTSVYLDGEKYTLGFGKNGKAFHGVNSGYLYDNGILIEADKESDGYKYAEYELEGKNYLVNTSGKVMKAGTYRDSDGLEWTVTGDNEAGYSISSAYK